MAHKKQQSPITMDDVMAYLNTQSGPVSKKDLARAFGAKGDARVALKGVIKDLRAQGLIQTERGGRRIGITDALPERVVVEITGMDSLGDLMARPLEWTATSPAPQIIITKDRLSPPAGVGDIVQVKVKPIGNKMYHGEALRRMTAGENHMVGVYENGFVYSVDRRLKQAFSLTGLPRGETLQNKDIVIVDIPLVRERDPRATFVRKIGSADAPFAATLIAIYMHNLPVAFTEAAEKQANKATVPPLGKHREDLRTIPFVTIDGADARDFDDAVWAEPDTAPDNPGGWHLMIGIADVAWYVRPGTALDMDARLRGNSVYFPDRVIPMLPEALSNGVCSLNPNEPRAAMVCEVWIDANGRKKKHTFRRALIQSARRLTYDEVQSAMDDHTPIQGLESEIRHLVGAYTALKKRRDRRGVLAIDVPERQVVLNNRGQIIDVKLRHQLPSMQLIEEMMILANVAAAETLEDKAAPTMYRVHDKPSAQKIETLGAFLQSIGQAAELKENPTPADFNVILAHAKGTARDQAVNELVLRAQAQAVYSPDNIGHFGLALDRYAHFTSPIRRYADIMVHRALIKVLKLGEGALTDEETATFADTARHISYTERQAASAEQSAVDRYITAWMADKVGQAFDARISSVTPFGLFLYVEPYGADGFVPMHAMSGDFYDYDEPAQRVVGRSTGKTYTAGDIVRAVLKECIPITGSLTFSLIKGGSFQQPPDRKPRRHTGRRKKGKRK